jgi:hypothetical protein
MMPSIRPKQERMYTYTSRHCHLLGTLSKLLIENAYMAVGCIKPDINKI